MHVYTWVKRSRSPDLETPVGLQNPTLLTEGLPVYLSYDLAFLTLSDGTTERCPYIMNCFYSPHIYDFKKISNVLAIRLRSQ